MSKYIPTSISKSVFEIDYNSLYANGKRIILFDLDNTLISYYEKEPSQQLIDLGNKLIEIGFQTYVLTNNYGYRIDHFMETFPATSSGSFMKKPGVKKIKQYLHGKKIEDYKQIVMIGDQLVTDIKCANRLGVDSVLVKSISRDSEKFYTKINRSRERFILKKYRKVNPKYADEIWNIVKKEKKHG